MKRTSEILVSLAHCDLRHAEHPLAVGHYRRDVIVHAEAALNDALDGMLRRRFDLGVYPGPIGTSAIIRHTIRPKGAIVVGLGDVGDLTAEQLRLTFAIALRQYALKVAEDPAVPVTNGGYRSAAFSTLLVGTDGNGAGTLTDSIYAILRAALDVNRSLDDAKLFDAVRIDRIEFVELYEDVASRAGHVIDDLPGPLSRELKPGEALRGLPEVFIRPGGQFLRPVSPYESGWWQRIAVQKKTTDADRGRPSADTASQLKFTVLSDRARLEQDVSTGQRALVQQLMTSATSRPAFDKELSATLYQLLVPEPVKDRISQGGDLLLMVDRAGAGYPFELMAARSADGEIRPLIERHGILRQFETEQYRTRPEMARSNQIFVIGNPKTLLWPDLPGAQAEAEEVKRIAGQHGMVSVSPPRDDAERMLSMLMTGEYRILHFAAHGQYDPDPMKSGIIVSDRLFITPAEVAKLPLVPELVFLNCCYLGKIEESRPASPDPRLASSLAEGFIQAGVRAVVAAGWAVADDAGRAFAKTFYQQFLGGVTFGDAVKAARAETAGEYPDTNTWGAYQCYGNPDYRFSQQQQSAGKAPPIRFVSRSEALQALRTLASTARSMSLEDVPWLTTQFEARLKVIPEAWKVDGDLLTLCGEVAGELEQFDRAIDFYREAVKAYPATASVLAVEQLSNLLARSAASRSFEKGADASVGKSFEEAEAWLDWLGKLGTTKERTSLRGSLYKRMAICLPAKRKQYLRLAETAYGLDAVGPQTGAYQSLNALALTFVRAPRAVRRNLTAFIDQQWEALQTHAAIGDQDFWDAVEEPDTLLHKLVVHAALTDDALAELEARYARARRARPSPRQWASVTDHVWFLWAMTGDASLPCHNRGTSEALKKLHGALRPARRP